MSEKLKNYVGVALIVALSSIALAALVAVYYYGLTARQTVTRSFAVSGEGKVAIVPDIAQIDVGVITEGGNDLGGLQQENVKRANQIITFLKSKGVETKDVKTQQYNINPRQQSRSCTPAGDCLPPSIVGYTINQTLDIKIRDLARVSEIIGGLVGAGANSVSQLSFTVDDLTQVQQQAREQAMTKAQAKALAIARAGNFNLGKLVSLYEDSGPRPYADVSFGLGGGMESFSKAASMPSIQPGSQDVAVNVTLTYEIK